MPWEKINVEEWVKDRGGNLAEIREKQKLMLLIRDTRKQKKISQTILAKMMGVSQSRIAQIESGVGTTQTTFDVLFKVLSKLGYECKITLKKAA